MRVRALGAGLMAAGALGCAPPTAAQVTTPPREMGLPEAPGLRPDPGNHRIDLGNGVVAYVAEDATVPLVTVTAFVRAGYADGPDGAAEALAAAYRRAGPAGMGATAFRAELEAMTADYRVVLGPELLELSLDVPAADAPAALALLARLVADGPAVAEPDLETVRRAAAGADAVTEPSLAGATALLRSKLLAGTAYAPLPAAASASGLAVAAVRDFHAERFVSGNVAVAVGGDWRREDAVGALQAFAALRRGARTERSPVAAPAPPEGRTLHLHTAEKLQGWLTIGAALPPVPEEDEAALHVMNYVLGGGHFDTRLFVETRDKRGLTNDDSGFLEPAVSGPGTYTFRTYGRPEAVRLLLDITLRVIERMRSEPVTEEELFVAKGALADGAFAIRYRDGWATARSLAEEWAAFGGHDRSESWSRRVRAVTAGDVARVARRYLDPSTMTGVLVGPIAAIDAAAPLEGEGRLGDYARLVIGR